MSNSLDSKFDFKITGWLVPIAPFVLVPLVLLFNKIKEGFYSWESLAYYLVLPFFIGIALWVSMKYILEKSPKLILKSDHLLINGTPVPYKQIARIRLFSNSLGISECSTLVLKNGDEYVLGISLYTNGALIRKNLKQINDKLSDPEPTISIELQSVPVQEYRIRDFGAFKKIKQSIFRSYQTYIFWPLILMLLMLVYYFKTQLDLLSFSIMLFLLILFGFILVIQHYYFLISDEFLTIKNRYLPGWQRTFKRSDIVKTRHFRGNPRNADGIKITFSNYETRYYRSFLLSYKMFLDLINELNTTETASKKT